MAAKANKSAAKAEKKVIKKEVICTECNGTGLHDPRHMCPVCNGHGKI